MGGRTRVGIFTKRRCKAGEELTYDYNLEWNGFARIKCVAHHPLPELLQPEPGTEHRTHDPTAIGN